MERGLLLAIAVLSAMGAVVAEEKPLIHGRVFECGRGEASLRIWLFVQEDQQAQCKKLASGRFECRNHSGARVYATCEIGCVQTEGYSGCLAMTPDEYTEFRDRLPETPIFSVIGRKASGAINENCLLLPAREDSHCWAEIRGEHVVNASCGSVVEDKLGGLTWSPMATVRAWGSHCDCADVEGDEEGQRGCSLWPLILRPR